VYAKVEWASGKSNDFVLSSYGPSKAEIEVASKQSLNNFLESTFITKARISNKAMNYAREGEANCRSVVDISKDGFIYCYYQNMSARTLETDVYFKEFQGIKLRKPYSGRAFKVKVPPQQEKIVLLRILPNQDVKQVLAEKVRFIKEDVGKSDSSPYGGSLGSIGSPQNQNYGIPSYGSPNNNNGLSRNDGFVNLDQEAKENGDMKRVKDSLTGDFIQIFIYQYKHDDGAYLFFENKTKDMQLNCKVNCDLVGLEPIGKEGTRTFDFTLHPGSTHRIAFKKTRGSFEARFTYENRVKIMP